MDGWAREREREREQSRQKKLALCRRSSSCCFPSLERVKYLLKKQSAAKSTMKNIISKDGSLLLLFLFAAATLLFTPSEASVSPAAAILKKLSSVVKWPKVSHRVQHSGEVGNAVQFENGYFVQTIVEGDKLGFVPHTVRLSPEGELLAVDAISHNIVKITPPLSEYSRGRLVAGSFQGYSGHVDGKPSDSRFKHPKGVAVDDRGNVYVADTANLAIRKIGDSGVTTMAGGKSNVAGYRDGPSEDAKFSNDFDLIYVKKTCSLLVVDRGNAALRQISLQHDDCDNPDNSSLSSDVVLVIATVVAGYLCCMLQHGFGTILSRKASCSEQQKSGSKEKSPLVAESIMEEPVAGWPSLATLFTDLVKTVSDAAGNVLFRIIPDTLWHAKGHTVGTPLKDGLVMPEDEGDPLVMQKLTRSTTLMDAHAVLNPSILDNTVTKPPKSGKPKLKDPSLSGKHKSSKRQEFSEFYSSADATMQQLNTKTQKERLRHRHRDKSGDISYGTAQPDLKSSDYSDSKFDHYNLRSKHNADATTSFRY